MRRLFLALALLLVSVPCVAQPANGMQPWLDTVRVYQQDGKVYVTASGWAIHDGRVARAAPRIAAYIDDWYAVGWGPVFATQRSDVCPIIQRAWGWLCQAGRSLWTWGEREDWWGVSPSDAPSQMVGVTARPIDVTALPAGQHFLRLWMWDTPPFPATPEQTPSNALTFTR